MNAHVSTPAAPDHDSHDQLLAHPVPIGVLVATFAALMILTVITVVATWVDLGAFNIWLALLIAFIKGSLVALYFMHLRWDSPFNTIVLIAALFFVALFIGIAVLDTKEYRDDYNPPARQGTPLQQVG
jgi:cytochrome c oxidase subunit 4